MVVWSGRGIYSLVVLVLCFIASAKLFPAEYSDYCFILSFFIAAVFSWFMGRKWNNQEGEKIINPETGQTVVYKPNHTLFWIKMQYFGPVFAIFGLIILIQQF